MHENWCFKLMTQIIVVVVILIMRNRISDKTNLRSLRTILTGMLEARGVRQLTHDYLPGLVQLKRSSQVNILIHFI